MIPAQEYVLAGASEIDPETGTLYYGRVVVTVQRQFGKTTMDAIDSTRNCMMGPNRRAWYTAQDGTHAREKFREMEDVLEKSPIGGIGTGLVSKYLRGNGSELVRFINGSEWRPHAPGPENLHSKQSDKNTIDEAWAFTEREGRDLMQAITPTTTTRRMLTGHQPQTWIMSTEGTIESTWFNPILDECRSGAPVRTFFVDFGIPDDMDPEDLEGIAKWHPGYRHLFDMRDLQKFRGEFGNDANGFARAFGNRRTGSSERVIPATLWNAGRTLEKIPEDSPVCVGAAVGVDGVDAAITISGIHPELGKITEVIPNGWRDGSAWALLRLKELQANAGRPVHVAIDDRGPSAALRQNAANAGIPLLDVRTNYVVAACQQVITGLETGEWHFRSHDALEHAADLAARRWIQDGAWVWGRRASVGSIAALEAATLSSHGLDNLPEDPGVQLWV
ncbi:hypothetical protein [Leucobacter triazinivorans]|uniref:Terminase n=1 Tax=Leucobacter triazinivorans TaxID=1784719 RepID=A0A4P6KE99_9MICO|nr:hypothetical protein [Leucobacter triazinivorans]QBE48755.1 hypothetical protein EVS81_07850 [Leucobacter triazinivorans]